MSALPIAPVGRADGGWRAIPPVKSRLASVLLVAYVVEGVIGGGGRLFVVGPVTLKMLLFGATVVFATASIIYRKWLSVDTLRWLALFCGVVLFASCVGAVGGATTGAIAADISPLLSFLALPFCLTVIRDDTDVQFVSRLIRWSTVLLAVLGAVAFWALWIGLIPFPVVYKLSLPSNEFFWRGTTTFFYKGFVYMAIGIGFFLMSRGRFGYPAIALLLAVSMLSGTRGLILAIAAVLAVYAVLVRRSWVLTAVQVSALIVAAFVFADDYAMLAEARTGSDAVRVVQAQEVLEELTPVSILIGHGFGNGVPSRPTRMELMYLEVLHKQGLIGFAFWGIVLGYVVWSFKRAQVSGNQQLAAPFLMAVIAIYAQSLTNPFLNNPIGITIVLVSIASLKALAPSKSAVRLSAGRL